MKEVLFFRFWHIILYHFERGLSILKEGKRSADCHSVFKNGGVQTTKKIYTDAWIRLINQLERSNNSTLDVKNEKIEKSCHSIGEKLPDLRR